jgi:TRAP-type C4-dicarboxylate transport system permease small subunit
MRAPSVVPGTQAQTALEPPSAVRRTLDVTDTVVRAMAYVSGVVFLLLSFYMTLDVIGRKFFHISSAITDEVGGYGLAFGGMWAMAWTLRSGGHVRIDVLLPRLPIRVQAVLGYVSITLMAFFAGMVAIYCWQLAIDSWVAGARATSFVRTPLFVPQALMAIGISVLGLEALTILACGIVTSVQTGRLAEPPVFDGVEAVAAPVAPMRQPWDS